MLESLLYWGDHRHAVWPLLIVKEPDEDGALRLVSTVGLEHEVGAFEFSYNTRPAVTLAVAASGAGEDTVDEPAVPPWRMTLGFWTVPVSLTT